MGGDGGGAVELAGDDDGQVAAAYFADLSFGGGGQTLDLLRAEAGDELAFNDADGGGVGAVVADDALHFVGEMEVVGVGEAVGDDGGFESDLRHVFSFEFLVFSGRGKVPKLVGKEWVGGLLDSALSVGMCQFGGS